MSKSVKRMSISVFVMAALLFVGFSGLVQAQVITLRVLNYFDLTSPGAERELDEIWGEFMRRNPNIRLEREDLYLEAFHQKTEAYAAAGQLPDVLYMWPGGRSSTLHTQGLVRDLYPLLGDDRAQFSEAALVPQAGGYLGQLPIGVTASHAFYVNKGLLDELGLEVPKTYEDLVAMVPVLRQNGLETIIMGAQDDWVIQSTLFSMIAGRLAGDDFLEAILANEAKFTDAPFMNALEFYAQLFKDGILSRRSLQTSYGEVNGLFASGRAPFLVDGDWKVGAFLTDPSSGQALIPTDLQPNFLMTVFPAIPGEINAKTTSVVPSVGWGMNANIPAGSEREAAAWKLIMWLNSVEVQTIRLETGGSFPSRIGVTSDRLEPLAQTRSHFYANYGGTHVLDNVFEASVYGPLNIGLQEIALGLSTPQEVAQAVQRAFDNWYRNR